MNIAVMIPELGGGGAEKVAARVGDYFSEKGNNVYFFIGNYQVRAKYKVKGNIINTGIEPFMGSGILESLKMIQAAVIIKKYKKKYAIDVAISFMEEFNYINILSRGRERVIVRVCTILSQRNDLAESILLNKTLLGLVYNKADSVVVMTDFAKHEMENRYKIHSKKIVKIENPVDICPTWEEKESWKYGDHAVICVGRLEDIKRYNIAIRTFRFVADQVKDSELIILGEGVNKKRLTRLINHLGLEKRVHLLGFQKNVPFYLSHAKAFLVTSKTEGFHIGMAEAMAQGVPVISIDCPGSPAEILGKQRGQDHMMCKYGMLAPNVTGDLWEKESITPEELKLADGLVTLLQNKEIQDQYSKASLERSKKYSYEQIMPKWEKIVRRNRK